MECSITCLELVAIVSVYVVPSPCFRFSLLNTGTFCPQVTSSRLVVTNFISFTDEDHLFDYEGNVAIKKSFIKVMGGSKFRPGLKVIGMVHGRKAWPLGVVLDPSMLDRKRMVALGKASKKPRVS